MASPDCAYCAHQFYIQDGKTLPECTLSDGKPCVACERQVGLQIRIEETKKLLDKLIVEEREAREEINRLHDPFSCLPYEITSYIFQLTLPGFRVKEQVPSHLIGTGNEYCERQGLTLGAICRGWRQLSWSTPQLWCNIMVSLHYEPAWNQIHVMADWIERSNPLPLNISLFIVDLEASHRDTASGGDHDIHPDNSGDLAQSRWSETFQAFVDLFNRHSARWKTLSIQSPRWLSSLLTGDKDHGAPLLKTLRLMNTGFEYCQFKMEGPKPAPTYVFAAGYRHINHLAISWSNVTHATLDGLSVYACNKFLRMAPKLIELSLRDVVWYPSLTSLATSAQPPIEVPLRKFVVSASRDYDGEGAELFYSLIFDGLTLPLLEKLTILGAELPFLCITQFLERSCPPLKHLSMDIVFTTEHQQEALEFLYTVPPSVTHVALNWAPTRRSPWDLDLHTLFDHLARLPTITDAFPAKRQLLPNIEWFEYHINRESSDPTLWGRLPEILRPVSGNPRPLKLLAFLERSADDDEDAPLFLDNGVHVEESVVRHIIGLLEEGVDVHLPRSVSREELLALLED